jgi:DNA uptake protein ComE-like DNA-binding protein
MTRQDVLVLIAGMITLASCAKKVEETAAYLAECYGKPLKGFQQIDAAFENGYSVHKEFNCITKESYALIAQQKADQIAYNAPEAKAKREAGYAKEKVIYEASRAKQFAADQQAELEKAAALTNMAKIPIKSVEANTASAAELAAVITLDTDIATQIIAAREKQKFNDWGDLINNVTALSAAQTAVYASICGLTVNGQSFSGAPQNAQYAAILQEKYKYNSMAKNYMPKQ